MRPDRGVRRNIVLGTALVGVLVGGYTLVVLVGSPDDLFGWFSTLLSTVVSVLAALFIGLILFQHQTQVTDRKKKAELAELLKTELGEVRRIIEKVRTDVPDEALETTENSFTAHRMQYVLHYTHPLIVEEAAQSGLFDTEQTSEMLVLARVMKQHNVLRQEAMTLRVEVERARAASGDQFTKGYLTAHKQFVWALRALQQSEEDIIDRCKKLLESMTRLLRSAQSA
jgi:hypothetical protein